MEDWKKPPLVITATSNICWMRPEVEYPKTPDAIAEDARLCLEAGASVYHTHAEGRWGEVIRAIRSKCEVIIQCGMSSVSLKERSEVFEERADMISIILSHHDEAFAFQEFNVLHDRGEMEEYAGACQRFGVVPEFEIWHSGSIWNLRYLIGRGAIRKPYVTTLFFGWPGGTWSPPTIEEYLYRRKQMPQGSVCNVSVMGENQMKVLAAAIVSGDHVRVGTEDYPYDRGGTVAPTHKLVREIREVAEALGRPVADVREALKILGIERRK